MDIKRSMGADPYLVSSRTCVRLRWHTICFGRWMRTVSMALLVGVVAACGGQETSDEQNFTQAKSLGPIPKGEPTRHPIVLLHGFNASTKFWGFYDVADELAEDGHVVFETTVPPYNSVDVRAAVLAAQIDEILAQGFEKVNIVAHSMGGLDARYLVSSLGYGDRVASITTISTPHRGAPIADKSLAILDGLAVNDDVLNKFAAALGENFSALSAESDLRAAFVSLSEANAPDFNDVNVDASGVYYQSWAGVSSALGVKNPRDMPACEQVILGDGKVADKMDPLVTPIAAITHKGEFLPNDGLVSVESAKWGEFRGCVPADHLDEVGGIKDERADTRTGFDHRRFYRNLSFELAEFGF